MKIKSVRIENFRSYKDETISLDDYTCFVGCNGAGKSTLFHALNIFFRMHKDVSTDLSRLDSKDFHHEDVSTPIRISVTFTDLSDDAKNDLRDYVRLDKLIVSAVAVFDPPTGRAEVKQFGSRLGFTDFAPFFSEAKKNTRVAELKEMFTRLLEKYPELDKATNKEGMIESLHDHEKLHQDDCVPIESEDQFYGATKGLGKLAPYIQWVFVPAMKDASEEGDESKNSALGQLLARTVRSTINFDDNLAKLRHNAAEGYKRLLKSEQRALDDLSGSLQDRLAVWAHPNIGAKITWKHDPDKSIKIEEPLAQVEISERGFEGTLTRFGLGLQRSFLLALLEQIAFLDDDTAPTLVLGVEEPEIYQHPPQARYLAETLVDLSEKGSQILVCTHNPLFIPGDHFDKVGIVRECGDPSYTSVKRITYEDLAKEIGGTGGKLVKETGMVAKLYPSLDPVTNEMFFCRVLILVEGYEDVAYLTSQLALANRMGDFRKYGCHIVPVGGKDKLIKPLAIAKLLDIPTFVVFDIDKDKENIQNEEKRRAEIIHHKRDNRIILNLKGYAAQDEWPDTQINEADVVAWNTNLTDEIEKEFGADWLECKNETENFYEQIGGLQKNPLAIARTVECLWNKGKRSTLLGDLIERIIMFAENSLNHCEIASRREA